MLINIETIFPFGCADKLGYISVAGGTAAVVCRRSNASVAMSMAVINLNVSSVAARSLSMVLGTPITGNPAL